MACSMPCVMSEDEFGLITRRRMFLLSGYVAILKVGYRYYIYLNEFELEGEMMFLVQAVLC